MQARNQLAKGDTIYMFGQRTNFIHLELTRGNTENGEESPTSPAVNEPTGAGIVNPSFLSITASPLSNII